MPEPAPGSYHHGDLREALLDAVTDIVRQHGLESVTIRGAARRVGVSHTAAFRHFAGKRALLTAFAARNARAMAAFMDAEAEGIRDPGERVHALGLGYVRFAVEQPGAFRSIFREELIETIDPDYCAATALLQARLSGGGATASVDGAIGPETLLAWSAVHGLAMLRADGSLARASPEGPGPVMCRTLRMLRRVLEAGSATDT